MFSLQREDVRKARRKSMMELEFNPQRRNMQMADDPDNSKQPKLVSLSEKRKARSKAEDDEFLFGLADRLAARAETAEAAGDHETAIEMKAASEAVHAADFLSMALCAMESAHEEWHKLMHLKGKCE
jgi:hypothetical protein